MSKDMATAYDYDRQEASMHGRDDNDRAVCRNPGPVSLKRRLHSGVTCPACRKELLRRKGERA